MDTRLEAVLDKAKKHDFYTDRIPKKVHDYEAFKTIPYLSKEQLYRLKKPERFILFSSSGSSSTPKVYRFSYNDFEKAVERVTRGYRMAGITEEDIVMNTFAYGPYIAGHMYDSAARKIGCSLLPFGTGKMTPTLRKLEVMKQVPVSVINGNPTYISAIIKKARINNGLDKIKKNLRILQLSGESLSDFMREEIESELEAEVYNQYGTTEIASIGAECREHDGLHVFEDYFIEVIDPKHGNEVDFEEKGELVITELSPSGVPAIRYCTGDLVRKKKNNCKCGYNSSKISILGRLDDCIKIRGRLVSKGEFENTIEKEIRDNEFLISLSKKNDISIYVKKQIDEKRLKEKISEEYDLSINRIITNQGIQIPRTISNKLIRVINRGQKCR